MISGSRFNFSKGRKCMVEFFSLLKQCMNRILIDIVSYFILQGCSENADMCSYAKITQKCVSRMARSCNSAVAFIAFFRNILHNRLIISTFYLIVPTYFRFQKWIYRQINRNVSNMSFTTTKFKKATVGKHCQKW